MIIVGDVGGALEVEHADEAGALEMDEVDDAEAVMEDDGTKEAVKDADAGSDKDNDGLCTNFPGASPNRAGARRWLALMADIVT